MHISSCVPPIILIFSNLFYGFYSTSPKKAPAYERFHSLAQPQEATVTLPLPYKYKVLGEVFNSCDTILNLMGQRKETCTFDKLKESVQQMSRKYAISYLQNESFIFSNFHFHIFPVSLT